MHGRGKSFGWLAERLGLGRSAVSLKACGRRPWTLDEAREAVRILRELDPAATSDLLAPVRGDGAETPDPLPPAAGASPEVNVS